MLIDTFNIYRLWKTAPCVNKMPSIQLDKARESPLIEYIRWKTHNDWIEQIRIDRRLGQIISCSNDPQHSLIIGCISQSEIVDAKAGQNGHQATHDNNHNQQLNSSMMSKGTDQAQQSLYRVAQSASHKQNAVVVSSSSLNVSRRRHETVFKVPKGVKTFDFSFEKNLLITGG